MSLKEMGASTDDFDTIGMNSKTSSSDTTIVFFSCVWNEIYFGKYLKQFIGEKNIPKFISDEIL